MNLSLSIHKICLIWMPSLNWLACLHLLFVKNLGIIIYSTLSVNFSIELRWYSHYAKSVRIRILVRIFSYSDQNNSECGHFLRSDRNWITYYFKLFDVPDKPSSPLPNTHLSIRKNFRYLDSGYLEHFDSLNKVFPHERFFLITFDILNLDILSIFIAWTKFSPMNDFFRLSRTIVKK